MSITADDLDNLRHALGISDSKSRKTWGWRNRFCTTANDPSFARLVAAGFARNCGTINRGRDTIFCATREGCRAAGMTDAEIDLMEPRP